MWPWKGRWPTWIGIAEIHRMGLSPSLTRIMGAFVGTVRRHSGMLQAERHGPSARSTMRPHSNPARLAGNRSRDHDA